MLDVALPERRMSERQLELERENLPIDAFNDCHVGGIIHIDGTIVQQPTSNVVGFYHSDAMPNDSREGEPKATVLVVSHLVVRCMRWLDRVSQR